MYIKIVLLCLMLMPSISQAKQLSQTFKLNHNDLKVVKGFQDLTKQGIISFKACSNCIEQQFTLTNNTILAENGIAQPLEKLLKIKLSNKTKHVLVQVNKFNQSVFYIEWGYPEGEVGSHE